MAKKDEILHIGIDLGTSRSAIVASNGANDWTESYVGWPKDFVARKMLGRDVLFGRDALDNRLSIDLFRPLEYGVIRDGTERDEEAVRALIRHLIDQVRSDKNQKVHAAVGVPAEALAVNKQAIREAVREHADALMVVSEPFSVAYGLDTLNGALIIDIGAGTIDFCVMHGTMPAEEDQRSLTTAGDHIDRKLSERLRESFPEATFSETDIRHYKEEYGFVKQNGRKSIKVEVPVDGKMTEINITDEMRQACESILKPIADTAIDLIARYEPAFQETLRKNIYLAGGGSQLDGIAEAIEKQLAEYGNVSVKAVDDPLYAGANGALALAQDMPEEYWEDM